MRPWDLPGAARRARGSSRSGARRGPRRRASHAASSRCSTTTRARGTSSTTNTLAATHFGEFRAAGFDVKVRGLRCATLLSAGRRSRGSARSSLDVGRTTTRTSPTIPRLALLFRDGGVYLDTDVVLARPLEESRTSRRRWRACVSAPTSSPAPTRRPVRSGAIGIESYGRVPLGSTGAPTCRARARAAMVMGGGAPVLNGAVLYFERGSRFGGTTLDEFAAAYRGDQWGWNGRRPSCSCASRRGATPPPTRRCSEPPAKGGHPMHWAEAPIYDAARPRRSTKRLWSTDRAPLERRPPWNRRRRAPAKAGLTSSVLSSWRENCCQSRGREEDVHAQGGEVRPPRGAEVGARKRPHRGRKRRGDAAAEFGHLEVLKGARERPLGNSPTCWSAAKRFGHLEVLKWARANGCPVGRVDVRDRGEGRPPRGASGRARTTARGTRGRAMPQRDSATSRR